MSDGETHHSKGMKRFLPIILPALLVSACATPWAPASTASTEGIDAVRALYEQILSAISLDSTTTPRT